MRYLLTILICFTYALPIVGQATDSSAAIRREAGKADSVQRSLFSAEAYVSSYFAYYDDELAPNGFVQFPTMAARNKQPGLNMALLGLKYSNDKLRGNFVLHFGDIPQTVWPKEFNVIQEANAGVQLVKKLWLDAGFFRSHIGVESTQPRENITSSMSLVNNFEPYFFAGAKLTYHLNDKLSVQLNSFNSFNSFVDNNKNKLLGFSLAFEPTNNLSFTYNFITGDETPDSSSVKHQRYYNNLYSTFKFKKLTISAEANYGLQKNSSRMDSLKNAVIYSGLIVGKYQVLEKFAGYARAEYFSDANKMLTGGVNTGSYVWGLTAGAEYKPAKTCALSAEWRFLESDQTLFKQKNYRINQRNEFILCLDLWF